MKLNLLDSFLTFSPQRQTLMIFRSFRQPAGRVLLNTSWTVAPVGQDTRSGGRRSDRYSYNSVILYFYDEHVFTGSILRSTGL